MPVGGCRVPLIRLRLVGERVMRFVLIVTSAVIVWAMAGCLRDGCVGEALEEIVRVVVERWQRP